MSLRLRALCTGKEKTREQMLAKQPVKEYEDGRTKQCHADECDINKIMSRFDQTGTISHLAKFEGVYADFADFDFHTQITELRRGEEIFAALPAETRREFGQDPQAFFNYVNDPENRDKLKKKLPALAKPGTQLPQKASADADLEAAVAVLQEKIISNTEVPNSEIKPGGLPKAPLGGQGGDEST